jgi:hypothetical protein
MLTVARVPFVEMVRDVQPLLDFRKGILETKKPGFLRQVMGFIACGEPRNRNTGLA